MTLLRSLLCAAVATASAICLATDCGAAERPELEAAAAWAGVPVATLDALIWHESRWTPGRVHPRTGAEGLGAVVWGHWGALLEGAGLDRADLHDPVWGPWATAEILRYLRARYDAEPWRAICLYGAGSKALRYRTHCAYSRTIERLARRARMGKWPSH